MSIETNKVISNHLYPARNKFYWFTRLILWAFFAGPVIGMAFALDMSVWTAALLGAYVGILGYLSGHLVKLQFAHQITLSFVERWFFMCKMHPEVEAIVLAYSDQYSPEYVKDFIDDHEFRAIALASPRRTPPAIQVYLPPSEEE